MYVSLGNVYEGVLSDQTSKLTNELLINILFPIFF